LQNSNKIENTMIAKNLLLDDYDIIDKKDIKDL
jgi:hypothetical protein